MDFTTIPILDLSLANQQKTKAQLQEQLRHALFETGFLYITNHGVSQETIDNLMDKLPGLFALNPDAKRAMSKLHSPAFLGYSGFAEETTQGKQDLREQFDFATEIPPVWTGEAASRQPNGAGDTRDFSQQYWRLYGPNQWPEPEGKLPGFRKAFDAYHDAVAALSYRFVHLIEDTLGIRMGTYDGLFVSGSAPLGPQHRIKLLSYPPNPEGIAGQGVGAHKDSSGWLTFLYQGGDDIALEVVNARGDWVAAPPIRGSFVVNFGNAFEAATDGAVRATIHRVKATPPQGPTRHSVAFFQGLPLDMTLTQIRSYMPEAVRGLRRRNAELAGNADDAKAVSTFLDPRWDSMGESQLRKWIRSHQDVARKWYDERTVEYYLS